MPHEPERDDERHGRISGDPDSHRVGRMGSSLRRPRKILTGMRRRSNPKAKSSGHGAGTTVFVSFEQRQQVVVKVYISRHKPSTSSKSLLNNHVKYLSRDGVGKEGKEPLFFDANESQIDTSNVTKPWQDDRHHFRVIISPERGRDIDDLDAYVRQVMEHAQSDLGTPLEWIATSHYNTDHPHAHVVVRGKRGDGQDLVIDRQYISQGLRDRASEVATQWLGERTNNQIRESIDKQIQAERWTRTDWILEKHAQTVGARQVVDIRQVKLHSASHLTPRDLKARLAVLQQLGLASPIVSKGFHARRRGAGHRWALDSGVQSHLKDLGERNDVIKQLHRGMGNNALQESAQVQRLNPRNSLSKESHQFQSVTGRVISFGREDEISDWGYVIIRSPQNKLYHARIRFSDLNDVHRNSVLQVGRNRQWRSRLANDITASVVEGVFSEKAFRAHAGKNAEAWQTRRLDSLTRQARQMLERLSAHKQSGVALKEDGQFAVNTKLFDKHMKAASSLVDVRIVSPVPLDKQIGAKPYTYLDMQLMEITKRVNKGNRPKILDKDWSRFLADRIQWLENRGFAIRQYVEHPFAVKFEPTAVSLKRNQEIEKIGKKYKEELRKPVMLLGPGQTAMGKYVENEPIHDGFIAIVEADSLAYLVPTDKTPSIKAGQLVDVEVKNKRQSHIQPSKIELRRAIVDRTR